MVLPVIAPCFVTFQDGPSFMPIIELQGVEFTHAPGKDAGPPAKALDKITLSIEKGDFVTILGRKGSGKSTLVRLVNALYLPDAGRVCIHEIDSRDAGRLWELRRITGVVFPDPDNQIIGTTVEEDIAFGPENLGLPAAEIRHRVEAALQAAGLVDLAAQPPHTLTAGEKLRLALAGILAMQADCIVIDAATTWLDAATRQELLTLLRRLNRDLGITILHVTPHLDEACLADRIIVLDAGKVVLDGVPDDVLADVSRIEGLGLGKSVATDQAPAALHSHKALNLPVLTMGGYAPGSSLLHRNDPRSKIILTLLFMVTLYGVKSYPALFLLCGFILLVTLGIGRSLTGSWRGLRPILWLAASAAFLNIFLVAGAPLAPTGILSHVSWEGLHRSAKMMIRLILLVSSATLLTATTTPLALTAGLESLLQPLKRIKLPVQQLAMLLVLALRFIPVIAAEATRIVTSRTSRSPALRSASLRQRLQSYPPLLFPLFVAIFQRGEALATAMEARCYRGEVERTRLRPLKFSAADLLSGSLMLLFLTLLLFVEFVIV